MVGIADDTYIAVFCRQLPRQHILGDIGVLEFVDKDVIVARLILGKNLGSLPKKINRFHQQVIEIQSLALGEEFPIAVINPLHHFVEVGGLDIIFWRPKTALCRRYRGEKSAGGIALGVEIKLLKAALDQVELVIIIVNDEL